MKALRADRIVILPRVWPYSVVSLHPYALLGTKDIYLAFIVSETGSGVITSMALHYPCFIAFISINVIPKRTKLRTVTGLVNDSLSERPVLLQEVRFVSLHDTQKGDQGICAKHDGPKASTSILSWLLSSHIHQAPPCSLRYVTIQPPLRQRRHRDGLGRPLCLLLHQLVQPYPARQPTHIRTSRHKHLC